MYRVSAKGIYHFLFPLSIWSIKYSHMTHGLHHSRYDVYLTKEPSVYESMAMVHSRVRRVVYGIENKQDGGLGGTGDVTSVHCLPGTNHRYRAFKSIPDDQSELYQFILHAVTDEWAGRGHEVQSNQS